MEALDNLAKTQLLQREPPDQAEFEGMVADWISNGSLIIACCC